MNFKEMITGIIQNRFKLLSVLIIWKSNNMVTHVPLNFCITWKILKSYFEI